jgi:chemotaxis protein methyltransferase CheR
MRDLDLKMSEKEFDRLSSFIYTNYGIKMPREKKIMLQCRLQKRLRELGIGTFSEYIDHVFGKEGYEEIILMMNQVSTNKTDFFREPNHFDFLVNVVLRDMVNRSSFSKHLRIWSAGCSSGEEAYTIAMVLESFLERNEAFTYNLYCTDISTRVLQAAVDAVYKEERAACIPLEYKRKYLLKSKDPLKKTVRIIPEIRSKATFAQLNLMDDYYDTPDKFDIIFCRNVLIYFDKATQEKVICKLSTKLKTGGYFFLGHSESIIGMNVPLRQIKPTVFVKI